MLIISLTTTQQFTIRISIHLMLMLIRNRESRQKSSRFYFNTSHVNVNRYMQDILSHRLWISIHLMLMLIAPKRGYRVNSLNISIHLMLMLIANALLEQLSKSHFNTSHVNVNPCVRIATNADILISIHLMLMLIHVLEHSIHCTAHISIHLMLMLITNDVDYLRHMYRFQYISC